MGFLLKISVLMYFHTMRSLAFNDTLHETLHIFRRHNECLINPIHANIPFLYPLKTSENFWFSDAFSGYRNGNIA